jgi:hypothetical protein
VGGGRNARRWGSGGGGSDMRGSCRFGGGGAVFNWHLRHRAPYLVPRHARACTGHASHSIPNAPGIQEFVVTAPNAIVGRCHASTFACKTPMSAGMPVDIDQHAARRCTTAVLYLPRRASCAHPQSPSSLAECAARCNGIQVAVYNDYPALDHALLSLHLGIPHPARLLVRVLQPLPGRGNVNIV